jgi:hypothetical protein
MHVTECFDCGGNHVAIHTYCGNLRGGKVPGIGNQCFGDQGADLACSICTFKCGEVNQFDNRVDCPCFGGSLDAARGQVSCPSFKPNSVNTGQSTKKIRKGFCGEI